MGIIPGQRKTRKFFQEISGSTSPRQEVIDPRQPDFLLQRRQYQFLIDGGL
jgi:hypothetical protein